jgi:hypothetical protein
LNSRSQSSGRASKVGRNSHECDAGFYLGFSPNRLYALIVLAALDSLLCQHRQFADYQTDSICFLFPPITFAEMDVQFELFTFCHYAYSFLNLKPLVPDVHCSHIHPIGFDCPPPGSMQKTEFLILNAKFVIAIRGSTHAGEEPRVSPLTG